MSELKMYFGGTLIMVGALFMGGALDGNGNPIIPLVGMIAGALLVLSSLKGGRSEKGNSDTTWSDFKF